MSAKSLWCFVALLCACQQGETPLPATPQEAPAPQATLAPTPPPAVRGRFIVLGFDGVDPRRIDTLIAAGKLPHIAALGAQGFRGALQSTDPPQSPVAWAAFATGLPPGEHGIFDFVRRNPQTYMPEVATTRLVHATVSAGQVTPASVENLRHGESFWDTVARHGVASRALFVPYAYPPASDGAAALAGLGVPDVRGTNSSFTYITSDAERLNGPPPAGGQWAKLIRKGPGTWQARIEGPRLQVEGGRVTTGIDIGVRKQGDGVVLEVDKLDHRLSLDETSAYITVTFAASPLLHIEAATRATLRRLTPEPEIYLEPLNITPQSPYLPLSHPATFATRLWQSIGPFKTVGWVDDTSGLGAGVIDDAQFLREAHATMSWTEQALLSILKSGDDQLVVAVFTSPDRISHMFYGAKKGQEAIDDAYVHVDKIVGSVAQVLHPEDTILLMSDHGFGAFRRGVNFNRWLVQEGWMKLKKPAPKDDAFFAAVDWAHTQAYAFGTGGIYLNRKFRESQGIVEQSTAAALAKNIATRLAILRDGKVAVVAGVSDGEQIYRGTWRDMAPDLRVALVDGYRASWSTALGSVGKTVFEDNTKKWSGDHASGKTQDLPGFLVTNRPLIVTDPRIEDIAATALAFAGQPAPAGSNGRPLLHFVAPKQGAIQK